MSSPSPRDVPNLVNLPDTVLAYIFSRLPLEQVLTIEQVSPQLRYHQVITLGRVRSLTVMSGPDAINLVDRSAFRLKYSDYVVLPGSSDRERDLLLGLRRVNLNRLLKLDALSSDRLAWLIDTFTSLVDVQIVVRREQGVTVECFGQLITLFTGWRHQLQSLTLLVHYEYNRSLTHANDLVHSTRLIESINALSNLKHLNMEFDHQFGDAILELSILGRLERFQFFSLDDPKGVLTALRRYAHSNQQLRQVTLGNGHQNYYPEIIKLEGQLCSSVTAMLIEFPQYPDYLERIDEDRPVLPTLQRMCTQFSALTYLDVDLCNYTTLELATALHSLKQLFYLKLHLMDYRLQIDLDADHSRDYSVREQAGPRLKSIQVLCLVPDISFSHQDLAHLFNFAWTFPSVRLVHCNDSNAFLGCGPCALSGHWPSPRPPHCVAQYMAAFKHCPNLYRAIYRYRMNRLVFSPTDLNLA